MKMDCVFHDQENCECLLPWGKSCFWCQYYIKSNTNLSNVKDYIGIMDRRIRGTLTLAISIVALLMSFASLLVSIFKA